MCIYSAGPQSKTSGERGPAADEGVTKAWIVTVPNLPPATAAADPINKEPELLSSSQMQPSLHSSPLESDPNFEFSIMDAEESGKYCDITF